MTQLYFKFVNHVNNIDGIPSFEGLKSKLNSYQNDNKGSSMVNGLWYDLNDYYKKVSGHDINDNGWTSNLQWLYLFDKTNSTYTLPLAYLSVFDTQEQADNYDVNNAHYSLYKIIDKTYDEQPNQGQNIGLTSSGSGYDLKLGENKTYYLRIDIGNPTDTVYNYPFIDYHHQPFNAYFDTSKPRFYDQINDITCSVPKSLNGVVYTGSSTTDVYFDINISGKTSVMKFNTNNKAYTTNYLNYNEYFNILPHDSSKPDKIIIDFLHNDETTVKIVSTDDQIQWSTIVNNPPVNYDFTNAKGVQVYLETDLKPDSTKYITRDDTVYNIYYFKNGKPDDLDINNYSLDYLNTHADTKYISNTKSNLTAVGETDFNKAGAGMKRYEIFKTPCAFTDYGYYLILPLDLKDCYGVLLDDDGKTLQKIFVNKKNKIEEQYRPKRKNTVIGIYDEIYGDFDFTPPAYYREHNKDYGITSKGFIDPNRYDDFICMPVELWISGRLGELPAFVLKYKTLNNMKTDLGGYYNPDTGKIDPIIINDSTGGSTDTGGSTGTDGSTGTGGSTGTTYPNTPIYLNDQIHLYTINQQNIIDLSSKDLSYQTSLKKFATYDVNNFINQVYILPFSLPNVLKENVSSIVTGLYKLTTDTIAINQDYYDLDLGSITIKPKYGNGFDYNITKCVLHLPFTNLINLDINDILDKTISIKYKVSLLNADTTIIILSDDNLIFTSKINIGTDLQLFSINSNNIAGLLNNVLKNEVLTPYITITRNKPINNLVSYETNEHNQLNNYTGFVQTNNSSVSCGTQQEQQEIEDLLNGGIYIK